MWAWSRSVGLSSYSLYGISMKRSFTPHVSAPRVPSGGREPALMKKPGAWARDLLKWTSSLSAFLSPSRQHESLNA